MGESPSPRNNLLLRRLSQSDLAALEPCLETVDLPARTMIYGRDEPIDAAYFPLSGVISLIVNDVGGGSVEMSAVGPEGMVGVPALLGAGQMPVDVVVQIPGMAAKIGVDDLRERVRSSPTFGALLDLYIAALLVQTGQNAACNRLHHIDARAARWLLAMHDRVRDEVFPLTQEHLAIMLGVSRPKVSMAVGALQRAGYLSYARGHLRVVDRSGLEAVACECYFTIRDEFERLLGRPTD